jgi:DNA-directed RNA polymerase specialized sigma24 family protein
VQSDDPIAAQQLWQRYVDRLIALARTRLGRIRTVADEEDVVVMAFEKFLRVAKEGRFPKLDDRDDLWQILVLMTEQVAVDEIRHRLAIKRGGGDIRGESAMAAGAPADASSLMGMNGVPGREPTPEFAALAVERYRELLAALQTDELREIAVAKMHGSSNDEIAASLNLSLRSVERKLNLIRSIWLAEKAR